MIFENDYEYWLGRLSKEAVVAYVRYCYSILLERQTKATKMHSKISSDPTYIRDVYRRLTVCSPTATVVVASR
jgi:hypothetical protein